MTPRTGTGHGVLNGVEGQGAGGVAGDDEEFGALLADQELRAFGGIAGDGAARLGPVGQPGGVAEKGEAGMGKPADQGAQDGEAAEAGVEDADGGGRDSVVSVQSSRMRGLSGFGVGDEVGASQVGVAGERGPLLAVHEEADLGHAGQVGVKGSADGEHGEGFGFEARGMAGSEVAGEIDDRHLRPRSPGTGTRVSRSEEELPVLRASDPGPFRHTGSKKTWETDAAPPGTGCAAFGAA